MIKNTDHCALCDLGESNLKLGLVCSLTNDSPLFHRTCSKIRLNNLLEDKLEELDEKSDELSLRKIQVIRNLILYQVIAFCIFIGAYLFYKNFTIPYDMLSINNLQHYSSPTFFSFIIILLSGFGLIGKAIGPFLNYLEDKKMNDAEIDKVYDILELYHM